jgi:hypothetical protein
MQEAMSKALAAIVDEGATAKAVFKILEVS